MAYKNKPEEFGDGSVTISSPAEIQIAADTDENKCGIIPPSCGDACTFSAHQLVCVGGQVLTTITPRCTTKVKCLESGFGEPCPTGNPAPCTFRFFQNLCVEVDVSIEADAKCRIDQVKCLGVSPGHCPPKCRN